MGAGGDERLPLSTFRFLLADEGPDAAAAPDDDAIDDDDEEDDDIAALGRFVGSFALSIVELLVVAGALVSVFVIRAVLGSVFVI